MSLLTTGRQIGRTIKNASRLRAIVAVFVRHGFYNIAEKLRIGAFIPERLLSSTDGEKLSIAERVRSSFEELGPTFIKLGQVLASRPDLVPPDFVSELSKLHDNVQPIPIETIKTVLQSEFGADLSAVFSTIEELPLGTASIAQVHRATLINGEKVVIKVQKPGIVKTISDDLNVLYFLAELIETYIPESRPYRPTAIIDEFFKTLELETNFVVEANNLRRFSKNFSEDATIQIPRVYFEFTTERVLTMEALDGIPLSSERALRQEGIDTERIIRSGLKTYLKMVFIDGLFHGDLHAGNFFVMPDNRIGLVDFGVVGRLNQKTQSAIARMLLALAREDYETLAYEYIDLAPYSEHVDLNTFAKDLRDLIAPYYGLTLKNVNLGRILLNSSSIAVKHQISLPTELMVFFKSVVAIEGLGRKIKSDFDFLQYSLEFAQTLTEQHMDPQRLAGDLTSITRDAKSLASLLPRHLNLLFRKWTSPNYTMKIRLAEMQEFKKSVESSFNLLFLGILISGLLLSASLILGLADTQTTAKLSQVPTLSLIGYLIAGLLSMIAFINYIKK